MRPGRPLVMLARAAFGIVILVSAPPGIPSASAGALRLIDGEGVVHFTNVPGDPRYRGLTGTSATFSGRAIRLRTPWVLYASEIREISLQYDVDPALVQAVIQVESAFSPSAVSPKGAGGLMQLMPRTADSTW